MAMAALLRLDLGERRALGLGDLSLRKVALSWRSLVLDALFVQQLLLVPQELVETRDSLHQQYRKQGMLVSTSL